MNLSTTLLKETKGKKVNEKSQNWQCAPVTFGPESKIRKTWPQETFDRGTFDRKWRLTAGHLTTVTFDHGIFDLQPRLEKVDCKWHLTAVKWQCGQMSCGQTSLAVNGPAVKCHLRSSFPNLGCESKSRGQMSPRSNVTAVKCPAVKHHWRSKAPRLNVTWSQLFLIFVAGQKSRGQMSPRSNVLRSNVTRGQSSCCQMSLAVKFF